MPLATAPRRSLAASGLTVPVGGASRQLRWLWRVRPSRSRRWRQPRWVSGGSQRRRSSWARPWARSFPPRCRSWPSGCPRASAPSRAPRWTRASRSAPLSRCPFPASSPSARAGALPSCSTALRPWAIAPCGRGARPSGRRSAAIATRRSRPSCRRRCRRRGGPPRRPPTPGTSCWASGTCASGPSTWHILRSTTAYTSSTVGPPPTTWRPSVCGQSLQASTSRCPTR
mmetsp:Transcript_70724/g.218726  ORF Transcript_70724/g.218726 Transcript_70724/m.218726 type:complete len:228 (+) Transcript_70724:280-963(+)